ncbi:MAG: hypothetical protein M3317_17195, partial [Actinomycetota bacterium]|nr:hypothetical protein [Actinomycetota bacterium]
MGSIPKQHIEGLSGASRQDAYKKVASVFSARLHRTEWEDEIAQEAGFGSVAAMHQQLSAWGFAGLLPPHGEQSKEETERTKTTPEHKARGSGEITDLPPAANAMSIFRGAIEKLSVFLERLPSRKEQRQGNRFVVSYAKPFCEPQEPSEEYGYLEAPPDAEPDEDGIARFTGAQAYRRVAGGASRFPDDGLTAAIAAAI